MKTFIEQLKTSLTPIWKNHRNEIILISSAGLILIISITLFLSTGGNISAGQEINAEETTQEPINKTQARVMVDISGAVVNPGIYEATPGARLKDMIDAAGGLSKDADTQFFARNFNLARNLTDQEKIHIPSVTEIQSGIFSENKRIVDFTKPQSSENTNTVLHTSSTNGKISINDADLETLDSLPSISKSTAQKIIDNRPYTSVGELKSKGIVSSAVYTKIKGKIQK